MEKSWTEVMGWTTTRVDIPENLPNLIHTDSRTITSGQWFLPIVGEQFDGHAFIQNALDRGASGFFFARAMRNVLTTDQVALGVEVEDTTFALQKIASHWRKKHKNCKVIGITGSSGKTTIKELCFFMLNGDALTLKTEGSLNNELGVPLTLCKLSNEHRYAVIEMGARHKGDIDFLGQIADQDVGVLANVGTAHLGEFGSIENILDAKMEISRARSVVYFRDDRRIHQKMTSLESKSRFSFGTHEDSNVRVLESSITELGQTNLVLLIKGTKHQVLLPYYHSSYPINVACVMAIAQSLGLPVVPCLENLKKFMGIKGRFRIHQLSTYTLIDDTYNANPNSMRAGLETVAQAYKMRHKLVILGDMKELGETEQEEHFALGKFLAEVVKPQRLVTIGPLSRFIAEGANSAGLARESIHSFLDVDMFIPELDKYLKDVGLLYVKASNSLKLNKIIDILLSK